MKLESLHMHKLIIPCVHTARTWSKEMNLSSDTFCSILTIYLHLRKAMYTLWKVFWHCFLNTPVKTHTSITLMSPSSNQPTGRLVGDPGYLTQQITFHTLHWGSALMSNWKFVLNDQGSGLLKKKKRIKLMSQTIPPNPHLYPDKKWQSKHSFNESMKLKPKM